MANGLNIVGEALSIWQVLMAVTGISLLISIAAAIVVFRIEDNINGSPYDNDNKLEKIIEKLAQKAFLICFIVSIIVALNQFSFVGLWVILLWFVYLFVAIFVVMLPLACVTLSVTAFQCISIMMKISEERQKFNEIYSENKIKGFIQNNDVFIKKHFFESLYEQKTFLSADKSENLKKAAFLLKEKFNTIFTAIDVPNDSSVDTYCVSLSAYANLKKEVEGFLMGAGMHDIEFITENTTGFVPKAYFMQRALNDLAEGGIIIKQDIGSDPNQKSNPEKIKYIYQHKQSQKPMKSIEIDID